MPRSRCYSELRRLDTFEDRLAYLAMPGQVGETTFGFDRWLNQKFYTSAQWRYVRREVILRDHGCDLGIRGHEIPFGLLVHHMNPISAEDIVDGADWILDPEFLVVASKRTHNAIHYGGDSLLPQPVDRFPGDTKLW